MSYVIVTVWFIFYKQLVHNQSNSDQSTLWFSLKVYWVDSFGHELANY